MGTSGAQPAKPADVTTLVQQLQADADALMQGTTAQEDQWDKPSIARTAQSVQNRVKQLEAATRNLAKVQGQFSTVDNHLDAMEGAIAQARKELAIAPPNRKEEWKYDRRRLAVAFILAAMAAVAVWWPEPRLGVAAILGADLYVILLLISASVRSDLTFRYRNFWYHQLYQIMPSRLMAAVFVGLLFTAIVLGFAALYVGVAIPDAKDAATFTPVTAMARSFLTLATFDAPATIEGYAGFLVICELANAILLILGIFAMLINRLSEF